MSGMRILAATILLALAVSAGAQEPPTAPRPPEPGSQRSAELGAEAERLREEDPGRRRAGYLVDQWWLNEKSNVAFNNLTPHKPMYVIVRRTDDVNQQPTGVPAPLDLDDEEVKFQLSFRTEIIAPPQFGGLLPGRLRLWFAYTQQSNWQVFNTAASRPFRDTNYEPEVILTIDTREKAQGEAPLSARPALVNLAFVHQSNGRSGPESRTWWRLSAQGGWQVPGGSLLARVWHTVDEDGMRHDNPDINDFAGRADLVFRNSDDRFGHFSILARANLRTDPLRGFVQIDWRSRGRVLIAPLHLQFTHGYGESLLDYNHKQTTFGVGFSFWDW